MDVNERLDNLSERVTHLTDLVNNLLDRVGELGWRIEHLERRVTALEQDVAVIKSTYVTKADLSEARNSIIMWVIGAFIVVQVLPLLLKTVGN